jgi:hypothetical protein
VEANRGKASIAPPTWALTPAENFGSGQKTALDGKYTGAFQVGRRGKFPICQFSPTIRFASLVNS